MFIFTSLQKKGLFLLVLACVSVGAFAQNQTNQEKRQAKAEKKAKKMEEVNQMIKAEEEGTIAYTKEWLMGGKLYGDGWGVFYEKAKMKSVTKSSWFNIEIGERKHAKEEKLAKTTGNGFFFGNPLIYGKQNNFLFTKVGFGQQTLIGGKGNKNGVAVSAVYGGGLSLGFLKPYYVDVRDPLTGIVTEAAYKNNNSKTDTLVLDPNAVLGSAGFFKGFNELKINPGVFGKTGVRFDYGRYNELVSALECGFNVEYYFKDMPIMALNEANKFFINLYVAIEFGRRK